MNATSRAGVPTVATWFPIVLFSCLDTGEVCVVL